MKPSELLADPNAWIQGESARNDEGCSVASFAANAVCWCVSGAFNCCYWDTGCGSSRLGIAQRIAWKLGLIPAKMTFPAWQDMKERTHAEVIAVLKAVGE